MHRWVGRAYQVTTFLSEISLLPCWREALNSSPSHVTKLPKREVLRAVGIATRECGAVTGEVANPNGTPDSSGGLSLSAVSPTPAGFHLAIPSPLK